MGASQAASNIATGYKEASSLGRAQRYPGLLVPIIQKPRVSLRSTQATLHCSTSNRDERSARLTVKKQVPPSWRVRRYFISPSSPRMLGFANSPQPISLFHRRVPGSNRRVLGIEPEGSGIEPEGPGNELEGPGNELEGPGNEPEGPGIELEGPGDGTGGSWNRTRGSRGWNWRVLESNWRVSRTTWRAIHLRVPACAGLVGNQSRMSGAIRWRSCISMADFNSTREESAGCERAREAETENPALSRVLIWWAVQGSNLRPLPCEGNALPLS